ncbi:hypothetical protein E1B06_19730 [Brevibacillus laterosporus]|nr:helix-turn-helix domain-containing protein [Brevibacillus laterosporus]MDF9413886.1 hypothetical protein [Brevibacillus laterosporus]
MSYKAITKALGIPSSTQVKQWVRKFNSGEGFMDKRGKSRSGDHPFIGRPQIFYCGRKKIILKRRIPKKAQSESASRGKIWKVNRFLIINELRKKYPLTWLVEIARVSRSDYYKWLSTN